MTVPNHQATSKRKLGGGRREVGVAAKSKPLIRLPERLEGQDFLTAHQVGQCLYDEGGVNKTHKVAAIIEEMCELGFVPPDKSKKRLANLRSEYAKLEMGQQIG